MDKQAIINALRNYAQATNNEVANMVAGPVDLVNAGLEKIGLGTKEPIGGSAWMQRQGLTAPVPEGIAQKLGEATGLVLPLAGMKAKEIAQALRKGGENLAKSVGAGGVGGGQRGAIVWQGSPHKFDRFDASKIGTGVGEQAYGIGSYLGEAKDVGKAYSNGYLYKVHIPDEHLAKMLDLDKPLSQQPESVKRAINQLKTLATPEIKQYMPELVNYSQNTLGKNIYGGIGDLAKEINPDYAGSAQKAASELLKDLGVPGLRYLDNITKSGTTGTRNLVVFPGNENMLTILERNGEIINPQPIVKALRNGN